MFLITPTQRTRRRSTGNEHHAESRARMITFSHFKSNYRRHASELIISLGSGDGGGGGVGGGD